MAHRATRDVSNFKFKLIKDNNNYDDFDEYASGQLLQNCDLQKDNMFKYLGIPDIHHRIFDDKSTCKYCCCNHEDCEAPVYYQSPDGPTRLVKWFVRSEETPDGELIVDEIPYSVKSFGNSIPQNYYITKFLTEIELPKSFRKNLI